MKKRVGLLGGTFNPPHIGHLVIANEALGQLNLDEIWFMPNGNPPHKEVKGHISNEQRRKMVELAVQSHPSFYVQPIELEREGKSYTVDTIHLLKEQHSTIDYYFIIGGDMVESLQTWYKIDELMKMVSFVGVNRPGHSIKTPFSIEMIEVPNFEISSSAIRLKCKEGKSIKYLVPDSVMTFIEEEKLYGSY
ncbi:nicotinate-nucleotide adenylyltransferase [Bacillus spongiae]|uniref:Probable nicotinate-nucleotide adenylyltransferase n=1 Tax=Bacillus spongiae TaxID=2683610 RepID=A0ABU8H8Y0_9BACI